MRHYWSVIGFLLLISAVVLIWPHITDFLASDECLDLGGSYDFIKHRCDFTHNHQHISPYKDWSIWLTSIFGYLGLWVLLYKSNLFNRKAQIEALLYGDYYLWSVHSYKIKNGQPLQMSQVFTVTREDIIDYLRSHPVPGLDIQQAKYCDNSDGRKIRLIENFYHIGWQERGIIDNVYVTQSEEVAREYWINFLASSLGLASNNSSKRTDAPKLE